MARQLLAGLVVLTLLAAGVYSMVLGKAQTEPDCEHLTAQSARFIVVDVSDRLEAGDREFIGNDVDQVLTTAPERTRIILLQTNAESAYEPVVMASVCTPRAAAPVSDAILQSQKDRKERDGKLEAARDAIHRAASASIQRSEGGARRSPLMETLIYISGRPDFRGARDHDIYIYSDMRQNSAGSSVYEFEKGKPAYFSTSGLRRSNFKYATVHVRLVTRQKLLAEDRLVPYWTSWIASVGGRTDWPN
jgi:hypothetical protein